MIQLQLDSTFRTIAMPILHDSKYQNMKKYVAHGHYSVYDHCFRVALFAYSYAKCKGIKVDYWSLIRGSLLHDYYLYDWHHTHEGHRLHGFRHPYFALHNAKKRFTLNKKKVNMILSHMFPLTFWKLLLSKEAWILTYADKVCANSEHASIAKIKKIKKERKNMMKRLVLCR